MFVALCACAAIILRDQLSPAQALVANGWKLVRHCPAGDRWHAATDHLRGTDRYGDPAGGDHPSAPEWTVPFVDEPFDEFLFALGDGSKWMILPRDSIEPSLEANSRWGFKQPNGAGGNARFMQPCLVSASSLNAAPHIVKVRGGGGALRAGAGRSWLISTMK